MEQRQHPYIFTAKAILCVILTLSLQFSLGGCGADAPGLLGIPGTTRIDLTADHPISQSLKGTQFAGARAIEVDHNGGTFRVVFDDQGLELSGTFTYVNGEPTVTQLVSTRGANTATFDLDVDKHVTCISTSNGHKLVMPEEWWTSGAYDDPANENPYLGANGGLLAYAERTMNGTTGDSGGTSGDPSVGGGGSGSGDDTPLPMKYSHAALGPAGLVFGVVAIIWALNGTLFKTIFCFLWCLCPWLCPPADAGVPTVGDIPFLGGFGNFTATKGAFEIIVSPQDAQGQFIGFDLPETAFAFQNVQLVPDGGGAAIAVSTVVTGIDVQAPAQGGDVTAVTIFDSSGSMSSNDTDATGRKAGGNAFFDRITQDDEVSVLDFGAGTDSGLAHSRLLQDFTSDTGLLRAALNELDESGSTPLYGSILDGLDLLNQYMTGQGGVIVVLTDGQDTDTQSRFDDVIAQAQTQQTQIYPIGLGDNLDFSKLAEIAQETGGVFAEATDSTAMEQAFDAIGSGVTVGKVSVHGEGTYQQSNTGQYKLRGDLLTDVNGTIVTTPFEFTVFLP